MKGILITTLVVALSAGPGTAQAETSGVEYRAGQSLPGMLTLNFSDSGRNARMTPIRDNYRPKVVFDGREVICSFELTGTRGSLAPGETGAVSMSCKEGATVVPGAGRYPVIEGRKEIGFVTVPSPSS